MYICWISVYCWISVEKKINQIDTTLDQNKNNDGSSIYGNCRYKNYTQNAPHVWVDNIFKPKVVILF